MKPVADAGTRARWAWRIAAGLALGLVFAAYLQPDLMLDLANRIWSCF
jgi:hypothetical protein